MTPDEAKAAGAQAARDGKLFSSNPFKTHQGSPERPLAFAWKKGFSAELSAIEIEEQEADGHFRSRVTP